MTLPKALKVIDEEAFYGDQSIDKVDLPDEVAVFKVFCKGVLSGKDRDSKIFRARGKKASKTA